MHIEGLNDVTGPRLRAFRKAKGQSAIEFWGAVGISRSRGYDFEKKASLPEFVARLVYIHHVAGIPTDMPVAELRHLAKACEGHKALKQSIASAQRGAELLSKAAGGL
ncbi:MAG: hypothetical protein CMJ75_18955 [Planctomycetaceae bacterium]|nr:hypothetical protein [Planctomycetaceae bacterium]